MSRDADAFAPFGVRPDKPSPRRAGSSRKKRRVPWLLALVVGLLTLGVLAFHTFQGALSCSQDTSYCADTRDENGVAVGGLQEGGPVSWYEAYDFGSSWQYRSVYVVGLLGLGLLVFAVVLPGTFRTRLRNVAVVVCLADMTLWVCVWSI